MEDHNNILKSNEGEDNGSNYKHDQKLESTNKKIVETKEENERLKLTQFAKNYQAMHMDFFNIIQHDKQEVVTKSISSHEESELVSLSLGISSIGHPIDDKKNRNETKNIKEDENFDEGLALRLNITFDPSSRTKEGKEEELTKKWSPNKVLKTTRTGDITTEVSQYSQLKKTRVCIRARCDTQTMNDGGQWRKYGQKIAKGNPCPRAYYRCTVSPSCPVRKQVQRCAEDMSILITTYEGTHDHSLHTSATAMAYTTSAAASMLKCSSFTSQQGLTNSNTFPIINSNFSYNLNPPNCTSTSKKFPIPQQLYFQNSSISSLNSHPTVTLDLTTPQTPFPIRKFNTPFPSTQKSSSTNPNLSSTITAFQSCMLPSTLSPYSGHFNYGGLINQYGNQAFQGHVYQPSYMMSNHAISQQPLRDSIVATTKAITTNYPKFQYALKAALTTYVGSNEFSCDGVKENHVVAENEALNLKLGGDRSYSKNTTCNVQKGNMFKFPPSQQ